MRTGPLRSGRRACVCKRSAIRYWVRRLTTILSESSLRKLEWNWRCSGASLRESSFEPKSFRVRSSTEKSCSTCSNSTRKWTRALSCPLSRVLPKWTRGSFYLNLRYPMGPLWKNCFISNSSSSNSSNNSRCSTSNYLSCLLSSRSKTRTGTTSRRSRPNWAVTLHSGPRPAAEHNSSSLTTYPTRSTSSARTCISSTKSQSLGGSGSPPLSTRATITRQTYPILPMRKALVSVTSSRLGWVTTS